MVFSIRKWTSRLLFIIVFAIMMLVVTGGYQWLSNLLSPIHPYKVPNGAALKVWLQEPGPPDTIRAADRLRWFLWNGE